MKLAFFIDGPSVGGGFYHMKNFIELVKQISSDKHSIVFIAKNKMIYNLLRKEGTESYFFKLGILNRTIFKLIQISFFKNILELISFYNPFHKFIKKNKIDYIIFNEPSIFILYCKHLNFVSYIFNTEIDEVSHFKEFRDGNYDKQKKIILFSIKYAKKIFVFTQTNKRDLILKYNCDNKKILIQNLIPYLPKIYEDNISIDFKKIFKKKILLDKNKKLLFYPAQFWEHKNHAVLIKAVNYLKQNKEDKIVIAFSGDDKGNLSNIKASVEKLKLNNFFLFLGKISELELIAIYKYCDYIIMPTLIGRCSLPLLESLYFEKTIFYNDDILDNSLRRYVIGFDPKDAMELSFKIKKYIIDKNQKTRLKNTSKIYEQLCDKKKFITNFKSLLNNL